METTAPCSATNSSNCSRNDSGTQATSRARRFGRLTMCLLLLAGCATPESRAEKMIARHGPACEKLGYETGTASWRDCVVALEQQRLGRVGSNAAIYNATRPR